MNNFEMFEIINLAINKYQAGNAFNPSEYNIALNNNSIKLFKRRLGMPEEYTPEMQLTQQSYAKTTRLLVDLEDFIIVMDGTTNPTLKFVNGIATHPTDMAYPIGMIYNKPVKLSCGAYDIEPRYVEMVDEGEYLQRRFSFLKPTSLDYPLFRIVANRFIIVPKTVNETDFTYIKYPVDAVFSTTTDSNGELVYDASSSTELEWNDLAKLDIISSILGDVAIKLRSNELAQYAESLKTRGI